MCNYSAHPTPIGRVGMGLYLDALSIAQFCKIVKSLIQNHTSTPIPPGFNSFRTDERSPDKNPITIRVPFADKPIAMSLATPLHNQISMGTEPPKWKPATWDDSLAYRDDPTLERVRVFFNRGYLFVDMGNQGINHANVTRLFAMLFFIWFSRFRDLNVSDLGGCVLEKPEKQGALPDLVLYIGENIPQWKEGEPRRIDLSRWRVPDFVAEIADTTLATDMDEKNIFMPSWKFPNIGLSIFEQNEFFAGGLTRRKTTSKCLSPRLYKDCPCRF
jgi:Uma2 family endonuclease